MALCSLDQLKALVASGDWTYASEDCKRKVRAYDLTDNDVAMIVASLRPQPVGQGGNFRKEYGSAQTRNFGVLDADDYLVWFDNLQHRLCRPNEGILFYLKLAIYTDIGNDLCVVVRLHPSS